MPNLGLNVRRSVGRQMARMTRNTFAFANVLKGRAWAIYDLLHEDGDTDTYEHLKATT